MVRLTHLSGSLQGTSSTSPNAVIRIGRGTDADVRYAATDGKVSTKHAEIRFDGSAYTLSDVGSSNGTLLNGKRLSKPMKLRDGDKIMFGAGGPEASFNIDNSMQAMGGQNFAKPTSTPYGQAPQQFNAAPQQPQYGGSPQFGAPKMAPVAGGDHKDANQIAKEAQQKIAQARAVSGGQPSGQTMFIMASALQQVQASSTQKASKRYGKIIFGVVLVALLIGGGMGFVIWDQKQQLEKISEKKDNADKQIQKIQLQMQLENDPEKLAALDAELTLLTGKAQQAIGEMEQKDKDKAAEMSQGGDELDHQIRAILRKFGAETYAVPPIFKERLKFYLDKMSKQPSTKQIWARKKLYWPIIQKEFAAEGMPEEMAYVAWQESNFDPFAQSPVGARGMWQFMDFQARKYGLHVAENWKSGGIDERTDVAKETKIAAKYLADLLAEFGADSFMLAIASYNKGENGLRNVLRKVGFRNRDFWHLYRMKLLPDETSEYVPQIIADAIIGNNPQKFGLAP